MSIRTERVAGVIRETITEVLAVGGVKDPRVAHGGLLTLTHVKVAADLGVAWIFVTSVGGPGVDQTLAGLRAAAGFLRGEVGKRLRARRVPELRFEADTSAEREARIEAAFREIEEERRSLAASGEPEAPGEEATDGEPGDEDAVPEEVPFEDTEPVDVPYPAQLPETLPGGGHK